VQHLHYLPGRQRGRLLDLIEIDAASNRGIDEIRDSAKRSDFGPTGPLQGVCAGRGPHADRARL